MTAPTDALAVYLEVLFARARPSTLVEVRWRRPTGMGRCFLAAGDRERVARAVCGRATSTDVYVGVLARWRRAGGRAAVVGDGRTLWVDLDTDSGMRALEGVQPAPNLIVASGGRGHLHAYWVLARAVPPAMIERANRRLAWALGGDLNSADAARILRPPQTVNHGRGGAPVALMLARPGEPCRLGRLVGALPDPPGATGGRGSGTRPRRVRGDALLGLEPERYVSVLTGQRVGPSRKVRCPLHDDRTASLHVYREPERGWFCFGCRRGGSVYDLAAALWRIEPRGSGFVAVREGLRNRFG